MIRGPSGALQPFEGLSLRRLPNGYPVIRVHYSADPEKDFHWVAREKPKYSSAYWNQEFEINAHARSGQRVYPEFDPHIHVMPKDLIPKYGCRYMAIDPHPRTPHAALWVLIDKWSDWYVYRELWPSFVCGKPETLKDEEEDRHFVIREYAESMAVLEGNYIEWHRAETDEEYGIYRQSLQGEKIIYRFMDQAGKGFKVSDEGQQEESQSFRYDKYGIRCHDPKKSHRQGEDAIHALLKPRFHQTYGKWPRIHISNDCVELILEINRYRYQLTRRMNPEKELKQMGVESRCHLLDCLRYLATANIGYSAGLAS